MHRILVSRNCEVSLQLLCDICSTLYYWCKRIKSREGTTQGNPAAMAAYALGLTPLLHHIQSIKRSVKHVAFADD